MEGLAGADFPEVPLAALREPELRGVFEALLRRVPELLFFLPCVAFFRVGFLAAVFFLPPVVLDFAAIFLFQGLMQKRRSKSSCCALDYKRSDS